MADHSVYQRLTELLERADQQEGGDLSILIEAIKKCRLSICHLTSDDVDEKVLSQAKTCLRTLTSQLAKGFASPSSLLLQDELFVSISLQTLCNAVVSGQIFSPNEHSSFLALLAQHFSSPIIDGSTINGLTIKTRSLYSAVLFQCCTKQEDFGDEICLFLLDKAYTQFVCNLAEIWLSEHGDRNDYLEWNFFLLEALFSSPHFGLIINELSQEQRLVLFRAFSNSTRSAVPASMKFFGAISEEFARYSLTITQSYRIDVDSNEFQCLAVLLEFIAEFSAVHTQVIASSPNASRLFECCLSLIELATRLPDQPKHITPANEATSTPYGFKCHVLQLLSNLVLKNAENKRQLRERRGVLTALVELMRRLDLNNPFAAQWCILVIRNACEDCPEMAAALLDLMTGTDFLMRLNISLPTNKTPPADNAGGSTSVPTPSLPTAAAPTSKPSESATVGGSNSQKNENSNKTTSNNETNPTEFFHYSRKDFVKCDEAASGKLTMFGDLLRSSFDRIASMDGVMRFRCSDMPHRIVEGESGRRYVLLLNVGRATNRRAAAHFEHVAEKPKPEAFNFSKCRREEIMFSMRCTDDVTYESESACFGTKPSPPHERNVIMVNVSPIGDPSCLIIPDRCNVLPQILTPGAVRLSLDTMLLMGNVDMRVGFNSLCAFASVNHLHLHIWSSPFTLYSETTKCFPVKQSTVEPDGPTLLYEARAPESSPVPGFAVDLASFNGDVDRMSQFVYLLCDTLVIRDTPQSVLLTWGHRFSDNAGSTIRCFIWPKRKISPTEKDKPLCAAVGEMAGYLIVKDADLFQTADASWWEKEASEQSSLPTAEFSTIRDAFASIASSFSASSIFR